MALIYCPECKKQISNKAATCPNCGYPLNETLIDNTKYNIILTDVKLKRGHLVDDFLIDAKKDFF